MNPVRKILSMGSFSFIVQCNKRSFGCVPCFRLSAYTGTKPDTRAQIILMLTDTSHVSNVRYHQVDHLQVAKGLRWYKLLKE